MRQLGGRMAGVLVGFCVATTLGCGGPTAMNEIAESGEAITGVRKAPTAEEDESVDCAESMLGDPLRLSESVSGLQDRIRVSKFPDYALETNRRPDGKYLAKVPIVIAKGYNVAISGPDGGNISFRFGGGRESLSVVFKCGESTDSSWAIFPGSFILPKPGMCVHLTVAIDGRTETLKVPVGRDCED